MNTTPSYVSVDSLHLHGRWESPWRALPTAERGDPGEGAGPSARTLGGVWGWVNLSGGEDSPTPPSGGGLWGAFGLVSICDASNLLRFSTRHPFISNPHLKATPFYRRPSELRTRGMNGAEGAEENLGDFFSTPFKSNTDAKMSTPIYKQRFAYRWGVTPLPNTPLRCMRRGPGGRRATGVQPFGVGAN